MNKSRVIKIAILAVAVIIVAAIFSIRVSFSNRFPPYTKIAGIGISYDTREEAEKKIQHEVESFLKTPVKLTLGDESIKISPAELGLTIEAETTISTVFSARQKEVPLLNWVFPDPKRSREAPLLVSVDYEILQQKLEEKFNLSEIAPVSPTFYLEGKTLKIGEGASGQIPETLALLKEIKASAQNLQTQDLVLTLKKADPGLTKDELETQKADFEAALNHEFVLVDPIYSDDWEEKLINHLDWVTFANEKSVKFTEEGLVEKEEIVLKINQEALNKYIDEELSKWLDVPTEDVKIYYDENKKVVIEGAGNDGKKIERAHLKKGIEIAVAEKIREVPIPVITLAPNFDISEELQDLGIKERIGIGHTSYYGSPANRVHNIKTGATKFTGVLIAPDEVFSFNKTLGPVDYSTGYREELVIKPEGTIPEYGGGLCQVSTTTYRAALFSGLPIVERNEHSYAVSYYSQILGHGLDATIYLGGPDLKFQNDTGHSILIQMYTKSDYELYVVLYGTKDGRTVEMEGPYLSNYRQPGPTEYIESTKLAPGQRKQIEKAHTGFNALWYRHVFLPSGETITDKITTNYQAIAAKILVATGELPGN